MNKFLQRFKASDFDQLKSVVMPVGVTHTKDKIKYARGIIETRKQVLSAFQTLFDALANSPRPEIVAVVLSEKLVLRTDEEQNYFVNAILGGFKLIDDIARESKLYVDGRNTSAIQLISNVVNAKTPNATDPYYKFSESYDPESEPVKNAVEFIDHAFGFIFADILDENTVANIVSVAFRFQHQTLQQNGLRSLMASFYRLEDMVKQSCLVRKISYINTYNDFLPYV